MAGRGTYYLVTAATSRGAAGRSAARLAAAIAALAVTALGLAARLAAAARLTAGGSGAAGRLAGRSGTTGGLAAGRLTATAVLVTEQTGLSVVRQERNSTGHQQGKQNLRFHGSPQKTGTGCSFPRTAFDSLQTPMRPNLIGRYRQTLRVALTGQTRFAIFRLHLSRESRAVRPAMPDFEGISWAKGPGAAGIARSTATSCNRRQHGFSRYGAFPK